jgi:hypothetical protein
MRYLATSLLTGLLASGVALAGVPDLTGGWSGAGTSILPDGTIVESTITLCIDHQSEGLFAGVALSYNYYPDGTVGEQLVFGTGYIDRNKTVTAAFSPPPGMVPFPLLALFDGKWTGNGIAGTVRDPSDGGTSAIWFSPDPDVECPFDLP